MNVFNIYADDQLFHQMLLTKLSSDRERNHWEGCIGEEFEPQTVQGSCEDAPLLCVSLPDHGTFILTSKTAVLKGKQTQSNLSLADIADMLKGSRDERMLWGKLEDKSEARALSETFRGLQLVLRDGRSISVEFENNVVMRAVGECVSQIIFRNQWKSLPPDASSSLLRSDIPRRNNRELIMRSVDCGCYACLSTFTPNDITLWCDVDESGIGQTAVCPFCHVDAVIPSACGIELSPNQLLAFQRTWFPSRVEPDTDNAT